jgi:NitT/TauT family transport system permease protein
MSDQSLQSSLPGSQAARTGQPAPASAPEPTAKRRSFGRYSRREVLDGVVPVFIAVLIGFLGLLAWQLMSGPVINPFFASKPTAIWDRLIQLLSDGEIWSNLKITLKEAAYGFLLGAIPGAVLGLILGRVRILAKAMMIYVIAFFTMPRLALAPLFVLWFGIDVKMKVIFTASIVFFPVFMVTFQGARDISEELIALVKIMGGSRMYVFRHVIVPSSFVWLFAGLKQAVPYALVGAVVGELIAANRGLGYLLQSQAGQFDTAGVFAVAFVLMFLGVVLYWGVRLVEKRVLRWKKSSIDVPQW